MRCDVCRRPLSPRTQGKTLVCMPCRMDGAAFAGGWATELRATGMPADQVAEVVGAPNGHAVRRMIVTHRGRTA